MSGVGPDRRSGYRLIPQSNSEDSELSEEELHSLYQDGFQIITKKHIYSSDSFGKKGVTRGRNHNTSEMMNPEKIEVKANRIFPPPKKDNTPGHVDGMSTGRKFSFAFSIFMCLFTVGLFLIVPCEWANCSCCSNLNITRKIWQKVIVNIELKGSIILVHTADWKNLNFLLMARGSIFADAPVIRTNSTPSSGGDVLAFDGLSGNQIWRKHFNKMPNEIDCALFSVKNQLPKDCVIVSFGNYVTVVSPETGKTFWNLPFSTRNNKTKEMFPLVLPDMNEDGVLDFLILKDANKLLLISGLNGHVLSHDFNLMSHNCTDIKNLRMHNESMLKLSCKVEDTYTDASLTLKDHLTPAATTSKQVIAQHYTFASLNRLYVHDYSIQVTNEGDICPRKCKTRVLIRNSKKKTVWSHQSDYSYAMTPISFDLNYTTGMYGFVFKIWEHEHEDTEIKKLKMRHNNVKLTVSFLYERTVIVVFNSSFDEPIQTINMSYNPILQLYDANKSIQPDPVTQQHSWCDNSLFLKSKALSAVMPSGSPYGTTLDYDYRTTRDKSHLGYSTDDGITAESALDYRRRKIIIADVGKKGSRQIITYYSTFEDDKRDNYTYTDYTLKSYIRMYDLEKEISRGLNIALT